MNMKNLAVLSAIAVLAGCAGHNPIDRVTYRNEPLVKQIEYGMSKDQVHTLGGPPSSEFRRTAHAGSCNNYVLNRDGKEQTYYVSFNSEDRVDGKGFTTCEEIDSQQRERH